MDKTETLAYALHQLANCNLFDRDVMKRGGDELLRLREENEELKNENFALAAGLCLFDDNTGRTHTDGGTSYCAMKQRAERAEAERDQAIAALAEEGRKRGQTEAELAALKAERDKLQAENDWLSVAVNSDENMYRKGMLRAESVIVNESADVVLDRETVLHLLRSIRKAYEEEVNK